MPATVEAISVSASHEDGEHELRIFCPPKYLVACRAIPGARWDKRRMCWTAPLTGNTAQAVLLAFESLGGVFDPEVRTLAEDALRSLEAKKLGAVLEPIPRTKTKPWRHQVAAFHFAKGLRGVILAMEMSTGKSKIAIDLIINQHWKRVLILCPKRVVGVWPEQFVRHSPDQIPVLGLDGDESVADKTAMADAYMKRRRKAEGAAVVVLNYEAAWHEPFHQWSLKQAWDCLILDEAHKIKDAGGVTSRYAAALGKRALHRVGLTGTLMPHSVTDVYGSMRAIDPSIFGTSYANFRARYCQLGGWQNHQVVSYQNQDELERKLSPVVFRVTKDVLDLPPFHHVDHRVTLGTAARTIYDDLKEEMVAWIKEQDGAQLQVTVANVLVKLLRLGQVTSGHLPDEDGKVHIIDTAKAEMLEEVVDGLQEKEPIICFVRFRHDLDVVQQVAAKLKRRYAELSGRRHDALNSKAMMSEDCDVAGIQIQAGGVGIDLSRAHHCIFLSVGYSLGDYEQALARVHRQGQKETTVFHHILASDSIDLDVQEALAKRKAVVEAILEKLRYGNA